MASSKFEILSSQLLRARLRVGRICGVALSIHWSWLPCLVLWVVLGAKSYSSWLWALGQILGVFLIVTLHELGHVVAARRLGQTAQEVILWPLGGLALVEFSKRWGTELLIAAAGPAVNLVLVPIVFFLWHQFGYYHGGDVSNFLWQLGWANSAILLFNLLPIWPLDGGRIIQSAMTARLGLARSRFAGSLLGIICAAVGIAGFMRVQAFMAAVLLLALMLVNVNLLQWSLAMLAAERAWTFHDSAICPRCRSRALNRPNTRCAYCGAPCNLFLNDGHCWNCKRDGGPITCCYCGEASEFAAWFAETDGPAKQNGTCPIAAH